MLRQTIFLLVLTSVFALQPTPVQQFLVIPDGQWNLYPTSWHIGDDIVSFYQSSYFNRTEGYLKISPETSQVERILVDTVSSCRGGDIALLDASYYHPTADVFLYYCVANNSLLTIGKDYKVQAAIPISTSQTFKDVILSHNEQGYVSILGLPDLMSLPATNPTELILVDLKTKAVENHVIFNKGSDSQVFVTGYAFDSGVSYVQTKALEGFQTVIRISKIVLSGNDYELVPVANVTSLSERPGNRDYYHNLLHVVGGYLFTNDGTYLYTFDKNGNLFNKQANIVASPFYKNDRQRLWIPWAGAQVGGSTLYAGFQTKWLAYSFENGTLTSSVIQSTITQLLVAVGGLKSKDLLIGLTGYTFDIRDAKTNATLYFSFRLYDKIIVSESHYCVLGYETLYVFDRKKSGQLLKTIPAPGFNYYDPTTKQLVGLSKTDFGSQITYTDLETLVSRTGPLIPSVAYGVIRHVNLTDPARPFFVTNPDTYDAIQFFVSPATYGAISWQRPHADAPEGIIVPGEDAESFTYVWNLYKNSSVINIDSFKYDKNLKSFTIKSTYPLTTNQTQNEHAQYFKIGNSKVVLSFANNITVVDLALKTFKISDVPALSDSNSYRDVGVFYDKNKTPYVSLSEIHLSFGTPNPSPQLFDFSSLTTMPGVIANLTRSARAFGNCYYALSDEFDDTIGVVRLYDACGAQGVEKISL